ncbi:MAG: hypothetical protein M3Z01_00075, partial [Thermoproteota archaeon]|nr:hypothetical protein [Thermoproteota archaeon]
MNKFLVSFIFSLFGLLVHGQQRYFIYLQSENNQPFFVKLDNTLMNSYPLGYVIIPKLDDGIYSISIGFPQSSYEQEFNCSINNKDVGFIIKNTGENKWELMNMLTMNIIIPGGVINKPLITYEKETDPFSVMLANAVHDSTILRKDVAKQVFTESKVVQPPKDSVLAISDVAVKKPDVSLNNDSVKNNIALESNTLINQKDSVINNNKATVSTPEVIVLSDKGKNDISKDVVPEKITQPTSKDTIISANTNTNIATINPVNNDSLQSIAKSNDISLLRSVIKRKLKKNNSDGMEMMYVDDNGKYKDT